ncbi:hypothetical protein TRFO_05504 [Tritrichomonas foetus]|uniref:GRAM domain-containing protein n=1 Tax=Tritrichomonas foetus TaxID=1144522 RepID=A0A1J4KAT7_9EUKA|nr:hypothetical protein TRFO_05504 [Tritrichomonas foetus]|eukprot:OHT06798.1 hypothetical protein TRFO_05504 [Tritrichomonas foetus]
MSDKDGEVPEKPHVTIDAEPTTKKEHKDKKPHKKSSDKKSKDRKESNSEKHSKSKSSSKHSRNNIDEPSEMSESPTDIISNPVVVTGKEYNIREGEIIYQSTASIINKTKTIAGNVYITYKALIFSSRQVRPSFFVELLWTDTKEVKKTHRRGYDKSVTFVMPDSNVIFTAVKDRDSILKFAYLIMKSVTSNSPTCGFLAKNDEAEVVWKINVLKAPHVYEDVVTMKFSQVFEKFRAADILNDMAIACGAHEYVASNWKSSDGLFRNVAFTQPILNPPSVSASQLLRKSGHAFIFESNYVFSRASAPNFLQMQLQFYCKEDGDNTQFRGAFILEWNKEITDKEFVEAAVMRMARMYYYYLKSIICGEKFNESLYEGKWRLHQPYVFTIISLIVAIISIIVLPTDTNWYVILLSFVIVVLFFYL